MIIKCCQTYQGPVNELNFELCPNLLRDDLDGGPGSIADYDGDFRGTSLSPIRRNLSLNRIAPAITAAKCGACEAHQSMRTLSRGLTCSFSLKLNHAKRRGQ